MCDCEAMATRAAAWAVLYNYGPATMATSAADWVLSQ